MLAAWSPPTPAHVSSRVGGAAATHADEEKKKQYKKKWGAGTSWLAG